MNLIILIVSFLVLSGCQSQINNRAEQKHTTNLAEVRPIAQQLFDDFAAKNPEKLQTGPCLGLIGGTWAIDIAHSPRIPLDNDPENQCTAYQTGQAEHLIEFNPNGQIITIK